MYSNEEIWPHCIIIVIHVCICPFWLHLISELNSPIRWQSFYYLTRTSIRIYYSSSTNSNKRNFLNSSMFQFRYISQVTINAFQLEIFLFKYYCSTHLILSLAPNIVSYSCSGKLKYFLKLTAKSDAWDPLIWTLNLVKSSIVSGW